MRLFHEKKARRLQIHNLLFDILCISNKEDITLFDLIQLCVHFPKETPFGDELNSLLKFLVDYNVRPRYVASPYKLHYKNYVEKQPNQAIFADFVYAFVD
jgi:hypothetical protein